MAITINGSGTITGASTLSSNVSLNGKLTVSGEGFFGRIDSSLEGGEIGFGRASDNSKQYSIDNYGSGSTSSLRILDASAGAVRLILDSSGRITKPYQPAWSAHTGSFSSTVTGSPNHVSGISYSGSGLPNGTLVNVGSILNTTTGRVTIPVAGYYHISIIGHKDTNTVARDAIGTLSVNGGYYEMIELYGNYSDTGASLILYLAANDWVEAGRNNGLPNVNRITFSGYLLG